mmetsp:Transcript_23180/g.28489  ORF Transcript_23180/g.28489 Transcript_23180/m.28489 type:complete len:357 (+) Transcript_23180:2-1072(+)
MNKLTKKPKEKLTQLQRNLIQLLELCEKLNFQNWRQFAMNKKKKMRRRLKKPGQKNLNLEKQITRKDLRQRKDFPVSHLTWLRLKIHWLKNGRLNVMQNKQNRWRASKHSSEWPNYRELEGVGQMQLQKNNEKKKMSEEKEKRRKELLEMKRKERYVKNGREKSGENENLLKKKELPFEKSKRIESVCVTRPREVERKKALLKGGVVVEVDLMIVKIDIVVVGMIGGERQHLLSRRCLLGLLLKQKLQIGGDVQHRLSRLKLVLVSLGNVVVTWKEETVVFLTLEVEVVGVMGLLMDHGSAEVLQQGMLVMENGAPLVNKRMKVELGEKEITNHLGVEIQILENQEGLIRIRHGVR